MARFALVLGLLSASQAQALWLFDVCHRALFDDSTPFRSWEHKTDWVIAEYVEAAKQSGRLGFNADEHQRLLYLRDELRYRLNRSDALSVDIEEALEVWPVRDNFRGS